MATSTVKLNGTTLMTVNDTTASVGDVESGKEFYAANGVKQTGTKNSIDVITGQFTISERTQSITINTSVLRYFILAPSDRKLKKPGYKATSVVFVDFEKEWVSYITTNNAGTDNLGYNNSISTSAAKVQIVNNGDGITLSSNATSGACFGYFPDNTYDWFMFDAL